MNTLTNKRSSTLSLWKFVAALLIMGHHSTIFYNSGEYPFHGGYIYTEFFFLLSGFFCMRFLDEKITHGGDDKNQSMRLSKNYIWKKYMRIFPYTTIAFIIQYVLDFIFNCKSIKEVLNLGWRLPFEISFLSNLRITTSRMGQLWYVAVMFVVLPIICYLYINKKSLFTDIIVWLFPVLWYGYIYTIYARIGHRGQFLDLGRATANMLLGCLIYLVVCKMRTYQVNSKIKGLLTVVAWLCFILTIMMTYSHYGTPCDFLIVLILMVCLTLLLSNYVYDFQCKAVDFLGELSMPIYIVHITVRIYVNLFFQNISIPGKLILYYGVSIVYGSILYLIIQTLTKIIRNKRTKQD